MIHINNLPKNKDFLHRDYDFLIKSISLLFSELDQYEQNLLSKFQVDEFILECLITESLQKILDVWNPYCKSSKLRLEMEHLT